MKDVTGSPGTRSGLALRVSQCLATAASFAAMAFARAHATNNYSAFQQLMLSMGSQFLWSFFLACLDIYSLKTSTDLRVLHIALPLAIGDWGMAIYSYAAASASAGVAFFFERDINLCKLYVPELCSHYKLSVILAFVTWSFSAASAASAFWVLASLD